MSDDATEDPPADNLEFFEWPGGPGLMVPGPDHTAVPYQPDTTGQQIVYQQPGTATPGDPGDTPAPDDDADGSTAG